MILGRIIAQYTRLLESKEEVLEQNMQALEDLLGLNMARQVLGLIIHASSQSTPS